MHQSDITSFSHCKIDNQIYKYKFVIKDIIIRFYYNFALINKLSA